ncbi:hypothetical protein TNIN_212331 [Trichonephila inaurata madagascariensis]|uniref:Uncharacterized protein n=1 Tax=Trichonephila inaurata madagascariensis TaxID=2747483 RepID=A0A8X7BX18_9ARAC|nr:hypothetical protein TNIN_212331 [Trichonephila inaurata madagascariensis]
MKDDSQTACVGGHVVQCTNSPTDFRWQVYPFNRRSNWFYWYSIWDSVWILVGQLKASLGTRFIIPSHGGPYNKALEVYRCHPESNNDSPGKAAATRRSGSDSRPLVLGKKISQPKKESVRSATGTRDEAQTTIGSRVTVGSGRQGPKTALFFQRPQAQIMRPHEVFLEKNAFSLFPPSSSTDSVQDQI